MTYDPEVKVTWLRMRIANAELAYNNNIIRRLSSVGPNKLRPLCKGDVLHLYR